MRSESAVRRLERRVESLEREVASLRHTEKAEIERARSLLISHLKLHPDVDPRTFAVHNDLPPDLAEKVLQEFDHKHWTVPVDD